MSGDLFEARPGPGAYYVRLDEDEDPVSFVSAPARRPSSLYHLLNLLGHAVDGKWLDHHSLYSVLNQLVAN